ncbi:MAG: acyltransferase family protein [Microthrixaceae bacterium]
MSSTELDIEPALQVVRSRRLKTEPLHHVPALDGLRAVAVVLVLFYHADFSWMRGGFLGVSVFFTLSGFLITALLLREWNGSGTVDGRRFWSRRLRRLSPASWVTIGVVVALGAAGLWENSQLRDLRSDVPWSLVDLINWHFIASDTSYGDAFSASSPLEHFWSLAVETQFYALLLIIVFAVLVTGRRVSPRVRLNRLTIVLVVATSLSLVANLVLARGSINRAYFGTDTRAAEMLIGALLACVTLRRLTLPVGWARSLLVALTPMALGVVIAMSCLVTLETKWLYPWGLGLTAVCTATVVAGLLHGGALAGLLSKWAFVQLGRISYGVYVIHWPVFLLLTPYRTGLSQWPLFAARMLVVLALSAVLFHYVETPVRTKQWPSTRTARLLAPATVVVLLVTAVLATRGVAAPSSFLTERAQGDIDVNEVGPAKPDASTTTIPEQPVRATRILLIGDSIAASLESALSAEFASRGVSFASIATPGCGVITGVPANGPGDPIREVSGKSVAECPDTIPQRQSEAVASFHPDLVVAISTWESLDRIVDGTWYGFGDPAGDQVIVDLYRQTQARLAVDGAAVAWTLMPDTVIGRTTRAGVSLSTDRAEHHRSLLRSVASQLPGTTTVDLQSVACPTLPCPSEVNGLELRPTDGIHFDTPDGAAYVARAFADQVMNIDLSDLVH